jgi:hypothetical protein
MRETAAHRDRTGQRVLCGACGWGPFCHVSRQRVPEVVSNEDGDRPFTVHWLGRLAEPNVHGQVKFQAAAS